MFSKEVRILLVMVIIGAASIIALVQYTDICRLQAVTLNGEKITRVEMLGLKANRPIVEQPLDSIADVLMTQQGIVQVDIDYKLPNTLRITTNNLDPKCYLLDATTGTIYGLDETGRVVPAEYESIDWDAPLFTGVRVKRIHDYPSDARVNVILSQLKRVRQRSESLYRQIEEIDLSRSEYALVTMANKPFRLKVRPDEFSDRYEQFDDFAARYHPATDSITSFDLTYADMIIRQGYIEPKEDAIIDTSDVNDKATVFDETETIETPVTPVVVTHPKEESAQQLAQREAKRSTATKGPAKATRLASVSKAPAKAANGKVATRNLTAKTGSKSGKLSSTTKRTAMKPSARTAPKTLSKKPVKKVSKSAKNG